jgi:hypothetical protein
MSTNAFAQVKADDSNIINKLFSLYKYSALEIHNYYESQHFKLANEKKVSYPKFDILIRRYDNPNTTDNYFLNDVEGHVFAVGYTTYSEQNYKAALKVIAAKGFASIIPQKPAPGETVYAKPGSYDRIIVMVREGKDKPFYTIQINNLYESAQLVKQ